MKRWIAAVLVLAMLSAALCGCGGGGKAEAKTLTPQAASATVAGVTVDVGSYVLDGETELTVQKRADEENREEGYKIESYDISVGELSQLSDFITIRIPYDKSYCEQGQDAARCVGAKYRNEATDVWEDVLFEVDAAAGELVIYTDHLSVYGAFHVRNEGQRGAYITDVYAGLAGIDRAQAVEALRAYVANGGEAGQTSAALAARMMAGVNRTADIAGDASFATDLAGSIMNFATLGHTEMESPLGKTLFEGLENTGKYMAAVKIGAVMLQADKTDEDVLGLYKDVANLAMSFVESKAIGMAMAALFVFDYTISEMFAQGMAMKRDKVNAVYAFFNDTYQGRIYEGEGGLYEARNLKGWRQALIDAVEQNAGDPVAAVEAEIDRYCNCFWNISPEARGLVMADYESKGTVSGAFLPQANSAEAQQMTADYKKELYERLYPVINSVSVYMQRKAEAEYLGALLDLKAVLNQTVTFSFSEELADGEAPRYAGYSMRFEPLSAGADAKTWTTGTLGEKGATGKTAFTLIGYLTAGAPGTLALYQPGDSPGVDTPQLTVPFVLTAPQTEVKIGGMPTAFTFARCDSIDYSSNQALELLFAEHGSLSTAPDGSFGIELPTYTCVTDDGDTAVFTDLVLKGTVGGSCEFSYTLDVHSFSSSVVMEVIKSDVTQDKHSVVSGVGTAQYQEDGSLRMTMQLDTFYEITSVKQETRGGEVEDPVTNRWGDSDTEDNFRLEFAPTP